jgi:hypothetical protein
VARTLSVLAGPPATRVSIYNPAVQPKQLAQLATDQDRIRKNLGATPREAEVYQTYLARLATQEREIDGLTARERQLMAAEFAARRTFEDFLANLSD